MVTTWVQFGMEIVIIEIEDEMDLISGESTRGLKLTQRTEN